MIASFGGNKAFDAAVYGMQDMRTVEYLQNQMQDLSRYNLPQEFISRTMNLYDQYNGSEALARASALINNHYDAYADSIRMINDVFKAQTANLNMQRYIMANPTVRELYLKNRIDGYSNSYVNVHGNLIGEDHLDYQRVMNGAVIETEEGHQIKFYLDDSDDDIPLAPTEQLDIRITWDWTDFMYSDPDNEYDLTDSTGGSL